MECNLEVGLSGLRFWLVAASCRSRLLDKRSITFLAVHLWAGSGGKKYQDSLDDVNDLLVKRPKGFDIMIGADLNSSLGFFDAECFPANVGLYS